MIVTPIADMIPESVETMIIRIEPSSQYAVGDAGSATIYISDTPPVVTVRERPCRNRGRSHTRPIDLHPHRQCSRRARCVLHSRR